MRLPRIPGFAAAVAILITAPALAQYPSSGMRLFSHRTVGQLGGGEGNDIWGWTDSASGREFALFGRTSGTAFVEVTDPRNPVYLGNLPSTTGSSSWRDIKAYQNHAYIVSDNNGPHGLQVFESGTIVVSDINSGLFVLGLGTCDIDGDSACNVTDIDLLTDQGDLASGTPSTGWQYDFNRDQVIDGADIDTWLLEAGLENGYSGAYLRGDANLDGVVDFLDFNLWASNRFQSNKNWSHGDFNGSGTVDFLDFNIWAANRFQSTPTLVPEPSAVTFGLALLGFFTQRRRK